MAGTTTEHVDTSSRLSREEAERHAAAEMEKLFDRVPKARAFHDGTFMEREYYARHLLETIVRIRLNNEVDTYCLHRISIGQNKLAATLATYLAEEFGHDDMFLADLRRFGISAPEVERARPFHSTELLIGYMYYAIDHEGPLATMVWNWFVEWYSDRYNLVITRSAAKRFGEEMVRGSMRHIGVDDNEDHVGLMFKTIEQAMRSSEDGERAKRYLTHFVRLVGDYFQELHVYAEQRTPAPVTA